ncbi:MAG: hypothetical protein JWQ63_3053 [Mucilaginibacter sp.]|jgi:hypothetical protein|nr:hypothetical protein [Mucilaginibacter sp.]
MYAVWIGQIVIRKSKILNRNEQYSSHSGQAQCRQINFI